MTIKWWQILINFLCYSMWLLIIENLTLITMFRIKIKKKGYIKVILFININLIYYLLFLKKYLIKCDNW